MSFDTPARRVSRSQNLLQIEKDDALRSYKIATDHPFQRRRTPFRLTPAIKTNLPNAIAAIENA